MKGYTSTNSNYKELGILPAMNLYEKNGNNVFI